MSEGILAGRRLRILLADDDDRLHKTLMPLVERRGHELISATTGRGALASATSSLPDIIVLDMEFPDADGRDLLSKLKRDERTKHIPIVVWSGREGHGSDSKISIDRGAEDYVTKGDPGMLLLKLERVMLRIDEQRDLARAFEAGTRER